VLPHRSLFGPGMAHCACHMARELVAWPSLLLQELICENMPKMGTESRCLLNSAVRPNRCHQDAAAGGRRGEGVFID
jgi:hypothetical protein